MHSFSLLLRWATLRGSGLGLRCGTLSACSLLLSLFLSFEIHDDIDKELAEARPVKCFGFEVEYDLHGTFTFFVGLANARKEWMC